MNNLIVNVSRDGFEYDIHSLIKAFFPDANVKVIVGEAFESSEGDLPDIRLLFEDDTIFMMVDSFKAHLCKKIHIAGLERPNVKNALKQLIYCSLKEAYKRELPWGTLTGIRPTKIAMTLLKEGADVEEIREYMKTVYLLSDEKLELAVDIARKEKALLDNLDCENGYSLYIGIPFCPTTCLYCSFTSYPIAAHREQVAEYLDALEREIDYVKESFYGRTPDTIYIGGGTPTTLEPEELRRLLLKLSDTFDLSSVKEFTVEAGRPDSITEGKLKVLKEYGVSRISVNPQTMNQKTLDTIGRRHTVTQTVEAFMMARRLGFDNINMDIILGLPGEEEAEVKHTIEQIEQLNPDSLTVHSLAVKRASKLSEWIERNGISSLKNTDATMAIASTGSRSMGMKPYYLYRQKNMSGNFENVGYAQESKEGLYNILIMEEVQTIVACGAGTVTKRVYTDGRIERCDNVKDVALYIEKIDEMIERKRKLFAD